MSRRDKPAPKPSNKFTIDDARPYAYLIILCTLSLVFVASCLVMAFSSDAKVVSFAANTTDKLIVFFITVGMLFFRLPGR